MTPNASDLLSRCSDGDSTAVRELVVHYQGMVFGLCYRMLGHRQDAEDVTQETLVRAIRGLATFDMSRPFEPWLLTIAANRCRTALVARARRPDPTCLCDQLPDPAPDEAGARHLDEELHLAMRELRDDHRQAFVLFHELKKSYLEIAEIMNCPVGTVKTWVHRARQDLISQLRSRDVLQTSGAWS